MNNKRSYLVTTFLVVTSFILSSCGSNASASGFPFPEPTEAISQASVREGRPEYRPGELVDYIAQDGDTISFSSDLAGDTIVLSSIITIDKNLVILSDVTPKIYIKSETSGEFVIGLGISVEFNNLNVISGSPDAPAAFDVLGDLILEDVEVFRNVNLAPGTILLENTGNVIVRGQTKIHE